MYRFLAVFLLLMSTLTAACGRDVIRQAHKTTHTFLTPDTGKCSGTAIGKHALLTATHCEIKNSKFKLEDGVEHDILEAIRDGSDHTIILTDATFSDIAKLNLAGLEQGDEVFIFGNPSWFRDLFRRGEFATNVNDGKGNVARAYNLLIYPGDSGAAIFDSHGDVRDTISIVDVSMNPAQNNMQWSEALALPIKFTPEQLKKAKDFDGRQHN